MDPPRTPSGGEDGGDLFRLRGTFSRRRKGRFSAITSRSLQFDTIIRDGDEPCLQVFGAWPILATPPTPAAAAAAASTTSSPRGPAVSPIGEAVAAERAAVSARAAMARTRATSRASSVAEAAAAGPTAARTLPTSSSSSTTSSSGSSRTAAGRRPRIARRSVLPTPSSVAGSTSPRDPRLGVIGYGDWCHMLERRGGGGGGGGGLGEGFGDNDGEGGAGAPNQQPRVIPYERVTSSRGRSSMAEHSVASTLSRRSSAFTSASSPIMGMLLDDFQRVDNRRDTSDDPRLGIVTPSASLATATGAGPRSPSQPSAQAPGGLELSSPRASSSSGDSTPYRFPWSDHANSAAVSSRTSQWLIPLRPYSAEGSASSDDPLEVSASNDPSEASVSNDDSSESSASNDEPSDASAFNDDPSSNNDPLPSETPSGTFTSAYRASRVAPSSGTSPPPAQSSSATAPSSASPSSPLGQRTSYPPCRYFWLSDGLSSSTLSPTASTTHGEGAGAASSSSKGLGGESTLPGAEEELPTTDDAPAAAAAYSPPAAGELPSGSDRLESDRPSKRARR